MPQVAARMASRDENTGRYQRHRTEQTITASMQDKYRNVFTTLSPSLASIVDNLGALESSTIGTDFAELAIVRNENNEYRAYLVYLIRGEDGVWRIDGM